MPSVFFNWPGTHQHIIPVPVFSTDATNSTIQHVTSNQNMTEYCLCNEYQPAIIDARDSP